ncbi:MAG: serine/threonine-protein kinase [Nannocystaceae bacterium]
MAEVDGPEWTPTIDRPALDRPARSREPAGGPAPAQRIGRFAILRPLGEGGMGKVYVGYDERLDRRVAIKLLRSSTQGARAKARLLREAQALACLSHPNVVQVHEAGAEGDEVFVAMELIEGRTLTQWAAERGAWRERLGVLLQAGRGLAAAHAAGLIHRDVKPDNILVGDDGRARVLDFGLVASAALRPDAGDRAARGDADQESERTLTSADAGANASTTGAASRPRPLDAALTVRGSIVGTPAYMAPEQHDGRSCGAAADQFSFCVCAFELLFGRRPFDGRALSQLALAKEAGEVAPIADASPVPRTIRAAILRGLAPDPSARWPDLDALLDALDRGLAPRRMWAAPALLGVAAAGVAAGLLLRPTPVAAPPPVDPCDRAQAAAEAAIDAVWTAPRRAALRQLAATPTAVDALDAWAGRWRDASRSACDDVHTRRTRSAASLDRRGVCLDRRLAELDALTQAVDAGAIAAEHQVVAWLGQLGDPRACLGEAVLAADLDPPPADSRATVAAIRRELLAASTGVQGDSLSARVAATERLAARAAALAWRPLIAEVALGLGRLHVLASDADAAREPLGRALDIAGDSRDLELEAAAWSELCRVERTLRFDPVAAEWAWRRQAAVFSDVPAAPRQRARLLSDRGQVYDLQAARGPAEEALRAALGIYEELGPTAAWERAATLRRLGALIMDVGRADEAIELFARARRLETGDAAPIPGQHSALLDASTLLDEALARYFAGEHDEALASLEVTLARATEELGPRSEMVARIHVVFAAIYAATERTDRLREHAERADAISLAALGPTHPFRADVLSAVGTAAQAEGRLEDARRAYAQALAVVERAKPEGSIEVAEAQLNLAIVLDALGDAARARGLLERCLPALERELPADHPELAMARGLGRGAATGAEVPDSLDIPTDEEERE